MPADFHLLRPEWLWLLLPMIFLLWRLTRTQGGGDAWRAVVDAHLLPSLLSDDGGGLRRLPLALLALGWLLAVLALAGPTWERLPQPVYQARDYRVVALDLSPGMNATDLAPSRLAHARFEVLDLLRKAGDGQTALLAYGAEPYVVSPLTSDTDTIAAQVPSLATALLPVQGPKRTDLALDKAGELLKQAGAPDGEVILVTDGLDHPGAADEAAQRLREHHYRVSVLGIGTAKGAPIPLAGGGFLKDAKGAILLPKLDTGALRSLADVGGGRYVTAGPDDRDVETLMPKRHMGLDRQAGKQDVEADQWREEGPWLLLLLLPLAVLAFRRGWLAPLVLLVLLNPVPRAHAFGWDDLWLRPDQQAERLLQAGKTKEAAAAFRRPDWRAAAQYQAGDYKQALDTLGEMKSTASPYNEGNTLARLGKLEQAVTAYDRALERNPRDEDARYNRDLVQKLLDQKKQQQNQQNQQGQQGQQDQKNQKNEQGQQDQNQQDQKSQKGQQDQKNQQGQQDQQAQKNQQGQQGQKNDQSQQDQKDQKEQQAQAGKKENPEEDQKQQAQQKSDQDKEMEEKKAREQQQAQASQADESKQPKSDVSEQQSKEPGLADLLGKQSTSGTASRPTESDLDPEDRQAMEQMLRRVEDDPGGLLRQRFLLQHLRRSGQL